MTYHKPLRTCRTFIIILIRRIEMLQVTQHAGHTLEPTETISNKELVDVLNLKEKK